MPDLVVAAMSLPWSNHPALRPRVTCRDCNGSGKRTERQRDHEGIPWGAEREVTCATCHGTGRVGGAA